MRVRDQVGLFIFERAYSAVHTIGSYSKVAPADNVWPQVMHAREKKSFCLSLYGVETTVEIGSRVRGRLLGYSAASH